MQSVRAHLKVFFVEQARLNLRYGIAKQGDFGS